MRALAPMAVLTVLACRSTAPYTVPSALLNTALAVGVSADQRAAGGCYAVCTVGRVCNPKTGFCEPVQDVCVGAEASSLRCLQSKPVTNVSASRAGSEPLGPLPPGVGVSPATGTTPALPLAKPSPENP
jgi:hypothetical protein